MNMVPVLSAWRRNRSVVDENLAKTEPVTFPYLQVNNIIHQRCFAQLVRHPLSYICFIEQVYDCKGFVPDPSPNKKPLQTFLSDLLN